MAKRQRKSESPKKADGESLTALKRKLHEEGTSYSKVGEIATFLLRDSSSEKPMNGTELLQKAKREFGEFVGNADGQIPDTTFRQYLSALVNDPDVLVTKNDGQHGYFRLQDDQLPESSASEDEYLALDVLEKDLYPLVIQWLENEGRYMKALDVSDAKGNGRWGHPDVLGLNTHTIYGTTYIEVCTVEVKRDDRTWKKDIHEAISHRRFSNRAYFAMLVKPGQHTKYTAAIEQYCDYYGIGLILLVPDPEGVYSVKDRNTGKEMALNVLLVHYAQYQYVEPRLQAEYLARIKPARQNDLFAM